MDTQTIVHEGGGHLKELSGHVFDVIAISKPENGEAALYLAKIISKLSPLVGNLIEFNTIEFLNRKEEFRKFGIWKRQDPGFPDTIFEGIVSPAPGFEIKAWFPLATEITARFRDSQNHFLQDQTYVAMLAWLPENLIWGRPQIIDVVVVSGFSVAYARDSHYHNPPDYLVIEPEDTTLRTINLQQTNTNGYKFQGTPEEFARAELMVASWGPDACIYKPTREYQSLLRGLLEKFKYRLDTNYAKMDRIVHNEIETFKAKVYSTSFKGLTIDQWNRVLSSGDDRVIRSVLRTYVDIP